ncbi:hypothetical protein KIN20_014167 [Parelaphostrongylus tenuis]|uniref:Uncharacterized protein n=1 Tax=Parelaphostrongylus tenuis TaxID=148309 RepID=A0AAD5MD73_PARTN|nr:hypothetical protein KIN20_014167 [Parelaphostrongylus tenuis]
MPPFAEKESSLLAKLKKSKPQVEELENVEKEKQNRPGAMAVKDDGTASLVDFSQPKDNGSGSLVDIFGHQSSGQPSAQVPSNTQAKTRISLTNTTI